MKLGIPVPAIQRNVRGCLNLGYCGMGCPANAKQSMLVTTIPAALELGATLLTRARAQRLRIVGRRVEAIEVQALDVDGLRPSGRVVEIRAEHVVLAGGAINSPAVLLRSKAPDPHAIAGTRTFLHPVVLSVADHEQEVRGFEGAPQTRYIDHFLGIDPIDGPIGFKLEAPPIHPVLFAVNLAGLGPEHAAAMRRFAHAHALLALMRDGFHERSPGGRVRLRDDGSPVLDDPLDDFVFDGARRVFRAMAEIQFAARCPHRAHRPRARHTAGDARRPARRARPARVRALRHQGGLRPRDGRLRDVGRRRARPGAPGRPPPSRRQPVGARQVGVPDLDRREPPAVDLRYRRPDERRTREEHDGPRAGAARVIARLQLWLLAAQFLLGVGLAVWLVGTGRSSIGAAVAIGIAAPIALHAVVLTADFAIAWIARGARPDDGPRHGFMRGLRTWMVAWAREIVDSTRTFSVSQPLLARRAFAVGAAHDQRLPVLLIHGYFCNRALWRPMAARLVTGGHAVDAVDLEPPFASIDDYAPRIAEAVDALRARTGAPQVALLGHSMGGLAARAYLRAYGDEAVACVVTLGTPHRGTVHARFGRGRNVRQMRRDSDWLRALAAEEPRERLERFTVVLSWQDNIVAPQAIQTLPGARTVMLHGLGHISLVYDARVARIVLESLAAAEAGRPVRAASAR
jgi:triacylglycerol esterase/lipase EstA (alpha/beta hydrolase family)